jgi:hypothetical protein
LHLGERRILYVPAGQIGLLEPLAVEPPEQRLPHCGRCWTSFPNALPKRICSTRRPGLPSLQYSKHSTIESLQRDAAALPARPCYRN